MQDNSEMKDIYERHMQNNYNQNNFENNYVQDPYPEFNNTGKLGGYGSSMNNPYENNLFQQFGESNNFVEQNYADNDFIVNKNEIQDQVNYMNEVNQEVKVDESKCTNVCPNSMNIDLTKLSPHCYIEQISTTCLAQFGYYVESNGNAIVIDPVRDIDFYLNKLKERNAKLLYVAETHFHADFVSGHLDLANKTGAAIVFGPGAQPDYEIVETYHEMMLPLSDKIMIQVLHTPGHTLESSCYLVAEKESFNKLKSLAVITGDTLFLGEVGRPDLACKGVELTEKDLAGMLYESIQYLKQLPDDTVVLPGHGAGSACGKKIQKGTISTIKR